MTDHSDLIERIAGYLATGGLFNPELANHDAVRDLLIESRDALSAHSLSLSEAREENEWLREASLHHETGERITRKDLNNAHRKGAEEGRLAAHLIDGVNSPLNACCYRDGCRALEARALAAEAAVLAVAPYVDSIVCYASTVDEHDGNRVAKLVNEAVSAIRAQGE